MGERRGAALAASLLAMTDEPDKAGNPAEKGREVTGKGITSLRGWLGAARARGSAANGRGYAPPRSLVETSMKGSPK